MHFQLSTTVKMVIIYNFCKEAHFKMVKVFNPIGQIDIYITVYVHELAVYTFLISLLLFCLQCFVVIPLFYILNTIFTITTVA